MTGLVESESFAIASHRDTKSSGYIISVTLELNVRTNMSGKCCSIQLVHILFLHTLVHNGTWLIHYTGGTPEWYTLAIHQSGSQVERQVCSCVDAAMETGDRCTHFNSQLENNLIKWK